MACSRSTAAKQTVRGQRYSARIVAGHGKRNTRQEPTQTTTDFRAQARFPTDHFDDCCMRVGDSEKTEGFPWRPLVRSAWPAGQI